MLVLPLMQRFSGNSAAEPGERPALPRWLSLLMLLAVATVPFWTQLGDTGIAVVLSVSAGFLAAFSATVAYRMWARTRAAALG
jgi:hypothetical protein